MTVTGNFLLATAGLALPLLTSILVVPLYLEAIGPARYGVLAVVWVVFGYFGFLDFGLAPACTNALSRLASGGASQRSAVLATTLWLSLAFGMAGAGVIYAAGAALIRASAGPLAPELHAALPWIALLLPVTLVAEAGGASLVSRERFLTLGVLETVSGVAGRVLPVLTATLIGPSLAVVIPAAFVTQLATTALVWAAVARAEPGLRLRRFEREEVRGLLGYGAWVSVTGAVAPVLETADQLIIGALLGPVAVALYAVPMSVATRSTVVCGALARALFPRLSQLPGPEATRLAAQATNALALGFAALCAPAIILAAPALRLWVGVAFAADAAPVAEILLLGAWASGLGLIPAALLQAQGRPATLAKVRAAELAPTLALVALLTWQFGLAGAAWAWAARAGVDCLALAVCAGFGRATVLRAVPALPILAAAWAVARFVPLPLHLALAAAALATAAGLAGLATLPGTRATLQALRRPGLSRA